MRKSVVKIWSDGQFMGVGILVSKNLIITCAHVLKNATSIEFQVNFPLLSDPFKTQFFQAIALKIHDSLNVDIALLTTGQKDIGFPAEPAKFGLNNNTKSRLVEVFGYPVDMDNGATSEGRIGNKQENDWIEIIGTISFGYFLQPGFSGGGVYDAQSDLFYGIVNASDRNINIRYACYIPIEKIISELPELQEIISISSKAYLYIATTTRDNIDENLPVDIRQLIESPRYYSDNYYNWSPFSNDDSTIGRIVETLLARGLDFSWQFVRDDNKESHLVNTLDIKLKIDTQIDNIVAIVDLLAVNEYNRDIVTEFDTTKIKRLIIPMHSKFHPNVKEYMQTKRAEIFQRIERYVSVTFCDLYDASLPEYLSIVQTLSRILPPVNERNTQSDKDSDMDNRRRTITNPSF